MKTGKFRIFLTLFEFCWVLSLLGCDSEMNEYKIEDVYKGLRDQVFTLSPEEIGLSKPDNCDYVYGFIMETGYPEGIATLVALADGTVSLYFSRGGGFIGLGEHEEPRKISEGLLKMSSKHLSECAKTAEYPMPKRDNTIFYLFTFDGKYTAQEKETVLGNDKSRLSPLFHKAHELITAIRKVDEKMENNNEKRD